MKIAIDLTSLYGRKHTGVEMYAIDLYRALLTTNNEIIPVFHVLNEIDDNPKSYIINKIPRFWLENIFLSRTIRDIKPEVVLFPIFPPPIDLYFNFKGKIVPTIHDLAFLKFRDTINIANKYYLTPKTKLALRKSDAIITISQTEKVTIKDYTDRPVLNCGENIAEEFQKALSIVDKSYLSKWDLQPQEYVISVSTIEPRKNLKYLLKVIQPYLKKNNKKLLLVGRKGWGSDEELHNMIEEMKDLVIFTGYVDFESLCSLYYYADFFVLLSKDEGFGRTPFEAVACGCKKIVLSDIPIFHETFDNNATFLPLNDIKKCQQILMSTVTQPVLDNFQIPFHELERNIDIALRKINKI